MDYSYQNTTLVLPSCKNWKTTKSMMSLVQVIYSSRATDVMWQQLWLKTYERFSKKNMNFWARITTRHWRSESETEFVNSSNWSSLRNETSFSNVRDMKIISLTEALSISLSYKIKYEAINMYWISFILRELPVVHHIRSRLIVFPHPF